MSRHAAVKISGCAACAAIAAVIAATSWATAPRQDKTNQAASTPIAVSERARQVHQSAIVFDGHNDLPWRLRELGDVKFETLDIAKRLAKTHTDIPKLREGGVKAQFWSVYIPSDHPNPARTVIQQIDLVHRMIERYPETFELALSADDVERIVKAGKIASLIGMEGGIAIENDLAMLRAFHRLGARYMTLTHNSTLDWADAATDDPKHGGLSMFGERVVREMNRLGMIVDISHVSAETMDDVLRVSQAPVIASHSGAFAVAGHPRNLPDAILKQLARNGGVAMIVFYPGFLVKEHAEAAAAARRELRVKHRDASEYEKAVREWYRSRPTPKGTIAVLADHIDHAVKVAGIDHVGIGSDFDGIETTLDGMEDCGSLPRLTEELLKRGYSDDDVRKILGGNAVRAFRQVGETAKRLQSSTLPETDQPPPAPEH